MAKIISPDDIKEIAMIIATEAVEQLQNSNPQKVLKIAGYSLHTFNTSPSNEQDKMVKDAFTICQATFAVAFQKEMELDPVVFFVNHTELFTAAELELEEYYIEEEEIIS